MKSVLLIVYEILVQTSFIDGKFSRAVGPAMRPKATY